MSSSTRTCFNRFCKEAKSDQLRRGWRLRNGDFAPLCHRCGAAFEEGRFCDTFHVAAAGWRNCESCGKRVHCGCIVSIYAYILLDAGGVCCMACTRRNIIMAHFPTITQSDGLPLKVQDAKGKEWVLHFRFWPNNNSRMYVLEGITPCIQSMQLQAVTFSRIDPEGKLVMGFRKAASIPPSDQDKRSLKAGSDVSKNAQVNDADPSGSWSKNDSSGYIAKDVADFKSFTPPTKRKSRGLGAKSKRLRIDQEDIMELKLTWEEAQGLLRPPLKHDNNVVLVEGHLFEEYEEAPILGKPTIFTTDQVGEKIKWAQCEDCLKWRKLPMSALLPSRWTCSANLWDRKRSLCSSAQEVTSKQLEDIVSSNKTASALKETMPANKDVEAVKVSKGPSTTVILGEDESSPSAQTTSRHPRHRSGCTCIVCIQPPSGKPKHKDTCLCNVCLTVKRRKLSLMKHFSEKETESARKKLEQLQLPDYPQLEAEQHQKMIPNENSDDAPDDKKSFASTARIDLNIQPDRDDVPASLVSHSRSMMRLVSGSHKLYPIPHGPTSLSHGGDLVLNKTEPSEGGQVGNAESAQHDPSPSADTDSPVPLCISISASIPASS